MLTNKTALVTGASRGIGAAIAKSLAKEGAFVIINYNGSKERADAVAAEIIADGGKAAVYGCNVSAECVDLDDGATQIIFSLSGQQLKEKRDQALDLIEPAGMEVEDDTEQMDKMSVYYEQYQKTGYQNERIAYTINKSGVLTGMEYSFDVKRPKITPRKK